MAACGSLQHFFEKPLPENPTLLESLAAWNQIKPRKPIDPSSFTEIFGELHFKEAPKSPPPSSSPKPCLERNQHPSVEKINNSNHENGRTSNKSSLSLDSLLGPSKTQYNGSGPKNSGRLQFCTEGLGSESSDDVEDSKSMKGGWDWSSCKSGKLGIDKDYVDTLHGRSGRCWEAMGAAGGFKKSRTAGEFPPPPITSMGRQGKPGFFFKSYRHEGRFVLREFKIPTQEFLHACREDGRLKLNFIVPDKENREEEEEGEEEEEEDENNAEEEEEEVVEQEKEEKPKA